MPAAKIELVRLDALGMASAQRFVLGGGEIQFQPVGNSSRNLILDRENIVELAVVSLRPQMVAVGSVDQLRGNSHPLVRSANAAFQHRCDVELPANFGDAQLLAFESER